MHGRVADGWAAPCCHTYRQSNRGAAVRCHCGAGHGIGWPRRDHVRIGPDAGVKRYPELYISCTDLPTVDKPRLRRRLGRRNLVEMRGVESAVRRTLGL